ncbi:hypothetical protein DRJ19_00290 [Candidatus Woesearchaeota archaeon]|nr:MAG: hypothetical protein DRJ19_00290 [Candidatus Woesearchaeota archaeon]
MRMYKKTSKTFSKFIHKALALILQEFPYIKFKTKSKFRKRLMQKNIHAIIALHKGRLVAFCEYALFKTSCRINAIVVAESFRGKGYGSKILAYVLKNLPKRIKKVRVIVWNDNSAAIRLYKKFGFRYEKAYRPILGKNTSIFCLKL